MVEILENFRKIKLRLNQKLPAGKWKEPKYHLQTVNPLIYNVGIPCGNINNMFVLDIDVKDDGLVEMNKYIQQYGEPETLTIETPSGGKHYYFNLKTNNPDLNYIIKTVCYTRSKIGGVGIDIRSNNGYVVAPPSTIDNIKYKIINGTSFHDIPLTLAQFLLGKCINHELRIKTDRPEQFETTEITNYIYSIDDNEICALLNKLEMSYVNEFHEWFKITNILKGLNKMNIWKTWSKQSKNYNSRNNKQLWTLSKPLLDVNYLVFVLRQNNHQIKYIHKYKKYIPLSIDNFYCKKIEATKPYVIDLISYEDFEKHETIIIQSSTGTGKTTAIANLMEKYIQTNKQSKFITLTTRTTLSDQHRLTFKNIKLKHYTEVNNLNEPHYLTVCLNSLHKLSLDNLEKTIVYIDEISSFLEFTHNETLDKNIPTIYGCLMSIVRQAKKVIVSDALINDNVIQFLKSREGTLFIKK